MYGFTYNGVHSSEFGLYYTRTPEEKWFKDAEYDVYDTDVEWKDGGYYYGAKARNRTFTLKCLFEEIDVATRERMKRWLRKESSGQLVFDDMPFVYWNVRPGKIPVGNWYIDNNEKHSGTVTITFTAYEPFGYLTRKSNSSSDPDDGANDYCNLIDSADMPAAPAASDTAFDIYNPGTETCGLTIDIAGTAENPFRFINNRNATICELNSLPSGGMVLHINGDTGYVSVSNNGVTENGFAHHDKGYIRLESDMKQDVRYTYNGMNGTLYSFTLNGVGVDENMAGATIKPNGISGTVFTVSAISKAKNEVYCTRTGSGTPASTGTCELQTINHISIQEKSGESWTTPGSLSITSISVDYMPRAL